MIRPGVLLGLDSNIPDVEAAFAATSTSHLIAISGFIAIFLTMTITDLAAQSLWDYDKTRSIGVFSLATTPRNPKPPLWAFGSFALAAQRR